MKPNDETQPIVMNLRCYRCGKMKTTIGGYFLKKKNSEVFICYDCITKTETRSIVTKMVRFLKGRKK